MSDDGYGPEERALLWSSIKTMSKQIDHFCVGSVLPDHRPLLGPALLMSSVREMREQGASYDEVRIVIERTLGTLQDEHEDRRKGLHIVPTPREDSDE
jgi:hypothetical protein